MIHDRIVCRILNVDLRRADTDLAKCVKYCSASELSKAGVEESDDGQHSYIHVDVQRLSRS